VQYESIDTTPRLARHAFTEGTGHLPQHNKQLDRCKRLICRCYPLRNSTTTEQPNAYGTPQSPRLNEGQQKVNICSWCFQGSSEKRCIGQDEEGQRQEEGPQEAPCASPQAQGRDREAQGSSLLHQAVPKVLRHVDCQIWYNFMMNWYKAIVYLNGDKVQEMFDLSLQELKDRLRLKIKELDATSIPPLTKLCCGPANRVHGIVRLKRFRYKQLKRKTMFLLAQNRTLIKLSVPRTLSSVFLALKVRANIIIGRTATLCGGARSKPCVIRSFNSSHL